MNSNKEKQNALKISETYYNKWRFLKAVKELAYYLPVVFLLPILIVYSLANRLPTPTLYFILVLGILALILYALAVFPSLLFGKQYLANTYKGTSLYLIETASHELDKGDILRVSFIMSHLFTSLCDYLGQIVFSLGQSQYTQSKMFCINPMLLRKKDFMTYFQMTNKKDELRNSLNQLYSALNDTKESNYIVVQNFIFSNFKDIENFSKPRKIQELDETLKIVTIISQLIYLAFSISTGKILPF